MNKTYFVHVQIQSNETSLMSGTTNVQQKDSSVVDHFARVAKGKSTTAFFWAIPSTLESCRCAGSKVQDNDEFQRGSVIADCLMNCNNTWQALGLHATLPPTSE